MAGGKLHRLEIAFGGDRCRARLAVDQPHFAEVVADPQRRGGVLAEQLRAAAEDQVEGVRGWPLSTTMAPAIL